MECTSICAVGTAAYDARRRLTNLDALTQHDPRFDPGNERDQHGTPEVMNCPVGGDL